MRKQRLLIAMFLILMVALGLTVLPSASRPVEAQGGNLLRNPGFEEGVYTFDPDDYTWLALYPSQREDCKTGNGTYLPCNTASVPLAWVPWWISQQATDPDWKNRQPEYKPARAPFFDRIHSGNEAAQYFTFHGTHTAGLLQVVTVPANSRLRFSIWGQAWSSLDDEQWSNQPTTVNMRVGIDPAAGSNPYSPTIVWSDYQQPYDIYSHFSVESQAQGDKVTVFTISSPAEQKKHNDIYWDDAELIVIGEGGAAPPPPPPANDGGGTDGAPAAIVLPSANDPTATPDAEGVIYGVVQAGDSFWSIAARHGLTIPEIYELNGANESTVLTVGDLLIVGHGTPGGAEALPEVPSEAEVVAEATPTPLPPAPTAEPTAVSGGAICVKAFDDANKNGLHDAGETMRGSVAFTISTSEKVISNYVTDGISEPYCIRALTAGNYQITRSIGALERLTTTGEWAASVTDGSETIFEFGSYTDASADAVAALVDTSNAMQVDAGVTSDAGQASRCKVG